MKIEIRYYSRSGNTKLVADAIGRGVGVKPLSIDDDNAVIKDNIDILFIGGALYAYGLDKKLNNYLDNINGEKIKRAVVFSTSMISKHSIDLIKKKLIEKNINVDDEFIYAKSKANDEKLKEIENISKRIIEK